MKNFPQPIPSIYNGIYLSDRPSCSGWALLRQQETLESSPVILNGCPPQGLDIRTLLKTQKAQDNDPLMDGGYVARYASVPKLRVLS